jgi:hypothetical protein
LEKIVEDDSSAFLQMQANNGKGFVAEVQSKRLSTGESLFIFELKKMILPIELDPILSKNTIS